MQGLKLKKSENPAQFNRNAGLKWNFEKILTPQTKKKKSKVGNVVGFLWC